MILDLPKVGAVQFRDDLTQEELSAQIDALAKKFDFEVPKSELTYGEVGKRAFMRGTKQLGSAFADVIPAMAGKALGFDEYAQQQMEEAKQTQQEINKYYAPQYPSLSDVKGVSDVPKFAFENIVEQIPNLLTSLIPGVGAEVLAARTAATGVAKRLAVQAAEKGLAGDAALNYIAEGVAKSRATAGNVGVFLGSYAQNAPEVFQNMYEATEGRMEPGAALLFGAAAATLDSVLPASLLKSITGPVKVGVVEKVLEKSGMQPGLARTVSANVLKSMGYEGLTEGAQEAISIAGEQFVTNNPQIFGSKEWNRIMESAVRGSVSGGAFGGVGGVGEHVKNKREELQAAERKALADAAKEAGVSIEELQQMQAQGQLPGFEAGPATQILAPQAEESAAKELKGKQLSLFDEAGIPTKAAEKSKAVGDKIEEARIKAEQKKQAAELKAAQQRIKQFLKAKQGELDLTEAPPAGGVAVEGQPDLFAPQVRPAVTPQEVPTNVVTKQTLRGLGIGPTATIIKSGILEGKDLTNPADAAEVRRVLEAYLEKGPSQGITEKVEAFLNRPEFKATEVLREQPTTEPITRAGEPGISGAERVADEGISGGPRGAATSIESGLGGTPAVARPAPSGEKIEQAPLGKKATADVAKAEAAVAPAVQQQLDFISENDRRANDLLNAQVRDEVSAEAAKQSNLKYEQSDYAAKLNELIPSEDHVGTEAHNALRLPGLFNEFFRLQEVTQKAQEPKQRAKNVKEMEAIKEAIHKSGPDADTMLDYLARMNPQQRESALSNVNKHARDVFTETAKQRVAEAKERLEKEQREAPSKKYYSDEEADVVAENLLKAIDAKNFDKFVDAVIGGTKDPQDQLILRNVKKKALNTKVVVGKVLKGYKGEGEIGSFDPDTNTITLDPEKGLTYHAAAHEIMHAAISHVLRNPSLQLTKDFNQFFEQLQNRLGAAYGAQDVQEFAAEFLGNKEFQALLKTIKAPKSDSMFARIIQSIAEFFGFRKGTSAYDRAFNYIMDAIDISSGVEALPGDRLFLTGSDFKIVGEIGKQMPALAARTLERTKNNLSNLQQGGYLKQALGLLRLDNINTLYGKQLPIKNLLNVLETRTGMQEHRIKEVNDTYNRMLETQKKFPTQVDKLNEIAYKASANELDLANPKFVPEKKDAALYTQLKGQFNALPTEVQNIYKDARSFYDGSIQEYEDFLMKSLTPSFAARMKNEFEAQKRLKGYIPFLRRGDYWVEYPDPDTGDRAASSFESIRERQQFIDTQLKPRGVAFKEYRGLNDIKFVPSQVPPSTFIGKVIRDMQQNGASDELINNTYQSYLALFPAQSITKQFMKRQNVAGMEKDIIRAYGDVGIKWSRKLTNSEFGPEIDKAVSAIQAQAQNIGTNEMAEIANHIANQNDFFHNPTFGNLTHAATTLSYFEYIAGNVSSALVNLTSLPMLVWPTLGAKFGYDKATSTMAAASKLAMNDWSKNARYTNLYNTLMDHAQLQHTMAREVLEGRRETTSEFTGLKAKIFDALSIPFAATERYNRATTAIAAFDLALSKGMNEQQAIDYALTTVKDLHTSGLASTAPSWMQNPMGRVFFTFKSYTWNSAFILARAFHQAFKGESPEVRAMARRQLLGIYGMAMTFAGVKGLPFFGAASTLAKMIQALFGDEDEPYDLEDELRQIVGELAYKGPVNYFTNLEIANRSGIAQDLLFRDDPRGVAEHGYVLSAMQQAFGPAGTYAVNVGNAFKMMGEGHTERAIEAMMPSFLRNGMKGARYMTEGAVTLKGDPIDEDVSVYNSVMQIVGFSPADISANYERSSAAKGYEKAVGARRQRLLNLHDMAKTAGDTDLLADVKSQINEFNSKHPKDQIDSTTLAKSEAARKAAAKNMINGVTYNKKLKGEIKEKFLEE